MLKSAAIQIFFICLISSANSFAIPINSKLTILKETKHDTTTLSTLAKLPYHFSKPDSIDLVQETLLPLKAFTGLGMGLAGYQVKTVNPDIAGDVGKTQYVETVNYDLAVFDKSTGNLSNGFPQPTNAIWKGFGGPCETELGNHTIVKYDQLAQRWILAQSTTNTFCIAVSASDDATGDYSRYAYQFDSVIKNAKFGLWPNAYFLSFDVFDQHQTLTDVLACALDRKRILAGVPADLLCKSVPKNYNQWVHVAPADLNGKTPPLELNMPGYFLGVYRKFYSNEFPDENFKNVFFKLYVDFSTPTHTVLDYFYDLKSPFLDSAETPTARQPIVRLYVAKDDRNLYNRKISYRQFKDYGSLLVSFPDGSDSELWCEFQLHTPQPDIHVYQCGALYKESSSTYTANIAMDKQSNIVIANNTSNKLIYPSMEIHYRSAKDGLGGLPNMQPVITGHGSQTATPNNTWGTYNSLVLDPVDDCTFWFAGEYLKTTGSYNWSTAIVHFRIPNCPA